MGKNFVILTTVNSISFLLLHEKQTNIQKEKTEASMTLGKFNTIPTSLLVYTLAKFLWSLNYTENKSTSSDLCLSLV